MASTADLVDKFIQSTQKLTATKLPDTGVERYAFYDACYLGNGSDRARLISIWDGDKALAQSRFGYLVGRTLSNVKILAERKTTNADGSARHEVDISYDQKHADGTTILGQTETLVAGSSSGTCAAPQNSPDMRSTGNRRLIDLGMTARNRVNVIRKLADGTPSSIQARREELFNVGDPGKLATYVVATWPSPTAGAPPFSLKLLSPRVARDAPEMQNVRGSGTFTDTNSFRQCRTNVDHTVANAATADCTNATLGSASDHGGTNATTPYDAAAKTAGDLVYHNGGLITGAEVTFQVFADDGWKTVNGQKDKTPIATYQLKIKNESYPFAQMALAAFPQFPTISPSEADIVKGFKATGGTVVAPIQAPVMPTGAAPTVFGSVSSYRQGIKVGSTRYTIRTTSINGTLDSTGTKATIPFGGKPDGASGINYADFSLIYTDRNGRDMFYNLQYN